MPARCTAAVPLAHDNKVPLPRVGYCVSSKRYTNASRAATCICVMRPTVARQRDAT